MASAKKEVKCTTYKKDTKDFYVGNGKIDRFDSFNCYVRKQIWVERKFRYFEGQKGRCVDTNGNKGSDVEKYPLRGNIQKIDSARYNIFACNEACENKSTCFAFWMESDLNCWLWIRSIDVKGEKNESKEFD